jgi:hypothetical protein
MASYQGTVHCRYLSLSGCGGESRNSPLRDEKRLQKDIERTSLHRTSQQQLQHQPRTALHCTHHFAMLKESVQAMFGTW